MYEYLKKHWITAILVSILVFLFGFIAVINLSGIPGFYVTDMYADMIYATEVWEHGSIFPSGWVFGNQFYVVATPVLAALICGIGFEPITAMGLASIVMAVLVVLSFYWMISPVFSDIKDRLFACDVFLLLPLIAGDAVHSENGWQLLFTMCSYYSCYAITAFLAFGLYIRCCCQDHRPNLWWLIPICILSYATGLQSLRQTAVMVAPLVAIEGCYSIFRCAKGAKLFNSSVVVAASITFSNLLGVVVSRSLSVDAVQIFGEIGISSSLSLLDSLTGAVRNLMLFIPQPFVFSAVCIVVISGSIALVFLCKRNASTSGILLWLLLLVSIAVIGAIDTLTMMSIREIYYFMLYPLAAFLGACLFASSKFMNKNSFRIIMLVILLLVLIVTCAYHLDNAISAYLSAADDPYNEVADYLLQNGYTTVYSRWNLGEKIAIASDMKIQAGFWHFIYEPFSEVRYLCNPVIFDAELESCAYVFNNAKELELMKSVLNEYGYSVSLLKFFPDSGIYLFVSDADLIDLID